MINDKHIKIAVTGGIGSGKSAAGEIIKELGFPVFSCDEIYASLCKENDFLELLNAQFPGCVKEGKLERKFLSQIVFQNEAARQKLNDLSHPRIMQRLCENMNRFSISFAEVPLLFESRTDSNFDKILVLLREKKRRMEAIRTRSGLSDEEIQARMERQFDYDAAQSFPKNCILLNNNKTLSDLKSAIREALQRIL